MVTHLSASETTSANLPPQGAVKAFVAFLKLLESRNIPKVDKSFLQDNNKIASGNERKFIAGLKFLGLVDKDGNATDKMNMLCVIGEKRKENLAEIVRSAYSFLFDVIKIDLEKTDPDTLVNTFKTDYKMGSVKTAKQGAQIFVFLAQQAGISISQQILEKISVSSERSKKNSTEGKKPKKSKPETEMLQDNKVKTQEKLPEEALARFTLKNVGYVDVKDKDTFELAKAYLKLLSKKLGITEEN